MLWKKRLKKRYGNYLLSTTDQFILDSISQLWNFLFRALKVILRDKTVINSLKILTPTVYMPDNKYLTCMWSSVRSYGVEVDIFEPAHLIAAQSRSESGDVIHPNWFKSFANSIPSAKLNWLTLKAYVFFFHLKNQGYQLVGQFTIPPHEFNAPLLSEAFVGASQPYT